MDGLASLVLPWALCRKKLKQKRVSFLLPVSSQIKREKGRRAKKGLLACKEVVASGLSKEQRRCLEAGDKQ